MKLKKKKDNRSPLQHFADEKGETYVNLSEQIKVLADRKTMCANSIKDMASKNKGAKELRVDGKATLITGRDYEVGFLKTEVAFIDEDKAKKLVDPSIIKKISKQVIDKELLQKAVEDGSISRKIAARIIKIAPGSPRVEVRKLV